MRRRHEPTGSTPVPARLRTFTGRTIDDWYPWHVERHAFYRENPDAWPNMVDFLCESYDARDSVMPKLRKTR